MTVHRSSGCPGWNVGCPNNDDQVEVSVIMRALDPEVMDAMWAAAEPLLPVRGGDHPLGCHNPRIPDRVCFEGILIRLVTGCSWVTAERLIAHRASDTTLRARRDEWVDAGVFDALADEALRAYDRIVGLDLSEAAVDGSIHKAPCGGDGTGKSPVDRGKLGWKWSLLTDRNGIPVSWAAAGANRNDITLFEPTVAAAGGLLVRCPQTFARVSFLWCFMLLVGVVGPSGGLSRLGFGRVRGVARRAGRGLGRWRCASAGRRAADGSTLCGWGAGSC